MNTTTIKALILCSVLALAQSALADDSSASVEAATKGTAIVLVGHGAPPRDFPKDKLGAAMKAAAGHSHGDADHALSGEAAGSRDAEADLGAELLNWPRTPENDPYFHGVQNIGQALQRQSGLTVHIGFNEFCAPTTSDAIHAAIHEGAKTVLVTTVMMTPGGGHSERDIRASIEQAAKEHPDVTLKYAWPFPPERIAATLNSQVSEFLP